MRAITTCQGVLPPLQGLDFSRIELSSYKASVAGLASLHCSPHLSSMLDWHFLPSRGTWHMPDCSSSRDTATCIGIAVFPSFQSNNHGHGCSATPAGPSSHSRLLLVPYETSTVCSADFRCSQGHCLIPGYSSAFHSHKHMPGSSSFLRATATGLVVFNVFHGHKPGCSPYFNSQMDGHPILTIYQVMTLYAGCFFTAVSTCWGILLYFLGQCHIHGFKIAL